MVVAGRHAATLGFVEHFAVRRLERECDIHRLGRRNRQLADRETQLDAFLGIIQPNLHAHAVGGGAAVQLGREEEALPDRPDRAGLYHNVAHESAFEHTRLEVAAIRHRFVDALTQTPRSGLIHQFPAGFFVHQALDGALFTIQHEAVEIVLQRE